MPTRTAHRLEAHQELVPGAVPPPNMMVDVVPPTPVPEAPSVPETPEIPESESAASSALSETPAAMDGLDAKRAAIIRAIVAARVQHAESEAGREERRQRKLKDEDLFGSSSDNSKAAQLEAQKEKGYRMQGEFGAKKFIKP